MSQKFKKEFKAFTLRIDPRVLARWQSGADLTGLSLNEYLCLWLTRTMLEGDEFAHALHKILSGQDNKRSAILDLLSDIQIENQKLQESYFEKILTETMNDKWLRIVLKICVASEGLIHCESSVKEEACMKRDSSWCDTLADVLCQSDAYIADSAKVGSRGQNPSRSTWQIKCLCNVGTTFYLGGTNQKLLTTANFADIWLWVFRATSLRCWLHPRSCLPYSCADAAERWNKVSKRTLPSSCLQSEIAFSEDYFQPGFADKISCRGAMWGVFATFKTNRAHQAYYGPFSTPRML